MNCRKCGQEYDPDYVAGTDLFQYYSEYVSGDIQAPDYCYTCLHENVRLTVQELIRRLPPDDLLGKAGQLRFKGQAIEGIDFYWEGDKIVKTQWHHIKRGRCCSSDCRHCPYPL